MGVALKRQEIQRVLANANEEARREGGDFVADPSLQRWVTAVRDLQTEGIPRTYLAIAAVLLVARSLFEASELAVLDIKNSTSERGYAAASIGSTLSAFAKGQRIDLRATSSQPLNNQPFTYKFRIAADMAVQDKHQGSWDLFYGIAEDVDRLSSDEAARVLALLFHLCRRVDAPTISVSIDSGGKATLDAIAADVALFVAERSDNGKVGQAFVAAVFDLLYTPDSVVLGDTQNPSLAVPGDVQVTGDAGTWLHAEAKQKVVVRGDVDGFVNQVHHVGGERAVYFAMANHDYPDHVSPATVERNAGGRGVGLRFVDSPQAALDWLLPLCPGSCAQVGARLLERLHARMVQSHCPTATLTALTDLASRYAAVA